MRQKVAYIQSAYPGNNPKNDKFMHSLDELQNAINYETVESLMNQYTLNMNPVLNGLRTTKLVSSP